MSINRPAAGSDTLLLGGSGSRRGLEGLERGTVKALRVAAPVYRYAGNGDTYASALQGGWDIKKVLGTVPVEADGSAYFTAPAGVPSGTGGDLSTGLPMWLIASMALAGTAIVVGGAKASRQRG